MAVNLNLRSIVGSLTGLAGSFNRSRQAKVYIVPTWFCVVFNIIILMTIVVGVSLQIFSVVGACVVIVFVELLSMIEAHVNLRDLSISCLEVHSGPAHGKSSMTIQASSNSQPLGVFFKCVDRYAADGMLLLPRGLGRYAMDEIREAFFGFLKGAAQEEVSEFNISPEHQSVVLAFAVGNRGVYKAPKVLAVSMFPFGMFRVFREFSFDDQFAVYPNASGISGLVKLVGNTANFGETGSKGSDTCDMDYSHHREYVTGDHLGRIDWRVSSRLSKITDCP